MLNLPLPNDKLTLESNENFTGTVNRAEVATSKDNSVRMYQVRFQPKARTNWHTHTGDQVLIVLEGQCLVKREGHPPVILSEGEAISLPGNERHWHGAVADRVGCHLALNNNIKTQWFEAVSGSDYDKAWTEVK
ncbi:MAG: cupin domain-containing protein [Trueperaceae bacterium]